MTNVQQYYQILELEPGATLEEIHQGYKDLAMVWHPDRFPSHSRLQKKAQKKFQEINEAHEKLRSSLLISVARSSPKKPESERSQPQEAPVQSKNYYQHAANNAKTEQERKYNYEYVRFANFNRRDVQAWLD